MVAIVLATSLGIGPWTPAALGETSKSPAAEDLASQDGDARDKAHESLEKGGANSIGELLHGLDSANKKVRVQSLMLIQEIKLKVKTLADDQIADSIARKSIQETDPMVKDKMLLTLAVLKGSGATRELKRFATKDPDPFVRRKALGEISDVSLSNESDFFRSQLGDSNEMVRMAAYMELAKLGDKSTRSVALQVLQRPPIKHRPPLDLDDTRGYAIAILGYLAFPEDIPRLKALSESQEESGRCLSSAFSSYHRALLLQLPPEKRLDALIKALDDPQPGVRGWAYGELYASKDPNTNDRLKQYLKEPGHLGYKQAADALSSR